MGIKYKISLTMIGIMLGLTSLVGISYLNYDKKIDVGTLVEANGELSVNYFNGKFINGNGVYNFSITNNSSKDFYYEIGIKELNGYDENLKFTIVSNEANININNSSLEKDNMFLADNILIKSKSTEKFTLTINNNSKTNFKLSINKINDTEEYFFTTIMKNNQIKKEPLTKLGIDSSNKDEGLIEDTDDYGLTYYFRGKVENNYVEFANILWRIVKINGDGTVKLIMNDTLNELSNYNSSLENIDDYENIDIINKLNEYYTNNLKSYEKFISNAKFCKEVEGTTLNNNKTYNSYTRLITNNIPSFNCLGETYRSRIGLISADEVVYAGANFQSDNKDYYLYNSKLDSLWWTGSLAKTNDGKFYPFGITKDGKISDGSEGISINGIRPVINIIKKTNATGKGTLDDPYVLSDK